MAFTPLIDRRHFVRQTLLGGLSLAVASEGLSKLGGPVAAAARAAEAGRVSPAYRLQLDTPTKRFDGKTCWCHPRVGIVPGAGEAGQPALVLTMTTVDLVGSDVFRAFYGMRSNDLGKTWSEPQEQTSMAPRYEMIEGEKRPVATSDFWPRWHAKSKKLLGTGHSVAYTSDWKVADPRPRHTVFSIYNPDTNIWSTWEKMAMPDEEKFHNAGAGSTQRVDLADGTILLPFYFKPAGSNSQVAIARCSFDGQKLKYEEHGDELQVKDDTRGLHEPSLAHFNGRYFLTLRNDKRGFVTSGEDGLHFEPYREWKFDDGKELGNYNTQQHWVTHSDGLFLVYTRRGANNDHIFRHRAPLFMAQVDPEKLVVIRETEKILIPQRGTRLGNFGVVDISPQETWVTDSEWMQPKGVEKYGSDGSVYLSRLHWEQPNKLF